MDNTAQLNQVDIHFLRSGDIEVGLAPALGGAISHAKFKGVDFMRPWTGEVTPRRTCGYPLVPFSNRIANGCFDYQGQRYQLERNFGDHPHTLHGVVWQRNWDFEALSAAKGRMSFSHQPQQDPQSAENWPFAFDVVQEFTLTANSLLVEMTITNTDQQSMPVGMGWHPFFPRHDGVMLKLNTQHVFLNDESMLPCPPVTTPSEWDFSQAKTLEYPGLDNCFSGWNRQVEFFWPSQQLQMTMTASEQLTHLILMTPPKPNNFFAVEPVSHANNAINMTKPEQHGLCELKPAQSMTVWMKLVLKEQI